MTLQEMSDRAGLIMALLGNGDLSSREIAAKLSISESDAHHACRILQRSDAILPWLRYLPNGDALAVWTLRHPMGA